MVHKTQTMDKVTVLTLQESALGTGDSSRVHISAAPGAFLVDIKVLTDSGGTNSQNSLNGIQWMINNVDTDWGNGAKGIQIGQMSFGSIGNPINQDSGDNGTGAEARLVNNATYNAGIACIIAAGNDGKQRIASPGSADGAITIGSADNADTINNHTMISWLLTPILEHRLSDNDNDDWDELKLTWSHLGVEFTQPLQQQEHHSPVRLAPKPTMLTNQKTEHRWQHLSYLAL